MDVTLTREHRKEVDAKEESWTGHELFSVRTTHLANGEEAFNVYRAEWEGNDDMVFRLDENSAYRMDRTGKLPAPLRAACDEILRKDEEDIERDEEEFEDDDQEEGGDFDHGDDED